MNDYAPDNLPLTLTQKIIMRRIIGEIRTRRENQINSGMVGGVREWFDIDTLLLYIEYLEDKSAPRPVEALRRKIEVVRKSRL